MRVVSDAVKQRKTANVKLTNESELRRELQSTDNMDNSITNLQYVCGYKPRPQNIGSEDSVLMSADKERGAAVDPQSRIEGSNSKPIPKKIDKMMKQKAVSVSSPITSFIKMVDFRQDNIRNVKRYMKEQEN